MTNTNQSRILALVLTAIVGGHVIQAALPVVSNVTSSQREGTKLVDIHYDVDDTDGDTLKVRVEISDDGGTTYAVPAFSFTGDIGDNVAPGTGKHIVWDAGTDWDGEYSDQMRVKVIVSDTKGLPGLEWGNEVPAGGFLMGQDGGAEGSGPSRHVNILWSYWLSKYEIRNDQYAEYLNMALAAGEIYRDGEKVYAMTGVYSAIASDNAPLIRLGDGYDIRWNVNKFEPVSGMADRPVTVTWYGAIAFAEHYGYDLPTDAEWEKAARGPDHDDEGEHLVYPWGDTITGNNANFDDSDDPWEEGKTPVGYYDGNQTPVGPDMISDYGLYDLIGNVSEWTRSVMDPVESYPQEEALENARHAYNNGDSYRVSRGGDFSTSPRYSYSYSRGKLYHRAENSRDDSWGRYYNNGFRVIRRQMP